MASLKKFEVFEGIGYEVLNRSGFYSEPDYLLKVTESEYGTPLLKNNHDNYSVIPLTLRGIENTSNRKTTNYILRLLLPRPFIKMRTFIKKILIKDNYLYITEGLIFNENKEPLLALYYKGHPRNISTMILSPKVYEEGFPFYKFFMDMATYLIRTKRTRIIIEDFTNKVFLKSGPPKEFINYDEINNKALLRIQNAGII